MSRMSTSSSTTRTICEAGNGTAAINGTTFPVPTMPSGPGPGLDPEPKRISAGIVPPVGGARPDLVEMIGFGQPWIRQEEAPAVVFQRLRRERLTGSIA